MDTTCPNPACGQTWALVPNMKKAHAGYRSDPAPVKVPVTNVWGEPIPGHITETMSSFWVSQGASVDVLMTEVGALLPGSWSYCWACHCGAALKVHVPAWETVDCTYHSGEQAACRVRMIQVKPPSDRYVNPAHGAACDCCGHQGTHQVRVDGLGYLPDCMKEGA